MRKFLGSGGVYWSTIYFSILVGILVLYLFKNTEDPEIPIFCIVAILIGILIREKWR